MDLNKLFVAVIAVAFVYETRVEESQARSRRSRTIVNLPDLADREKTGEGLWVLSMGHSCVAPAIRPFTQISEAAGYANHTQMLQFAGGEGGAARKQWERDGEKQEAKSALETGRFDRLTFGHFMKGAEVEDYARWIDFALEHNSETRFYIQDLWPWTSDLFEQESGAVTMEKYEAAMAEFGADLAGKVKELNGTYEDRVRVIPVGPAMVELVRRFQDGKLPQVDALVVPPDDMERVGLYRDTIHPTGVVSAMEGYVYFATLYGRNPAEVNGVMLYKNDPGLDRLLREIAWDVVAMHPLTGVKR